MAFYRSGGFRVLLVSTAVVALGAGAVGAWFYLSLVSDLPDLQTIDDYRPPLTSRVVDRNGVLIAQFSTERRQLAPMDAIPRHTRLAFVAAEDGGFYEHKGIDYTSILRAALANLRAGGEIKQGASTITQQTVKSLLLTPERTFRRKFREMILARKIEEYLTKDEILYLYLNQIYFGRGAWGIAEAARTYFDKTVENLTVSESAMLAGLPQRPNAWQPYKNPEAANKRRRYVLLRMLEDGIIDQPTYDEALVEVPIPTPPSNHEFIESSAYFAELVRQYLFERFGGDAVLQGGYTIETTIDASLQRTAVEAVQRGLIAQDHRSGYRGPLRRVEAAQIPETLAALAEENDLIIEVEEPDLAGLAGITGQQGEADPTADPNAIAATESSAEGTEALAKADSAAVEDLAAEGEREDPAAGGESEPPARPVLPFDEPVVGVVLEVDPETQSARVGFAPEVFGTIDIDEVSWARQPDPKRSPRAVTEIAKVFAVGDVAAFERLPDLEDPAKKEAESAALEEGEDPPAPLARVSLLQEPEAQGGLFSMDVATGDVLSLVGGYDYRTSEFNRVTQALRQPGSAFKPLIYGAALARGYTPVEILYDRPIVYEDPISGFKYKPENYERRFFGPVPMRFALAHSINNATVHLFRDVGVDYVIEFARRLGIQSPLERDLSLAIGSSSVTLLELTSAYAIFPNGGGRVVPRYITRVTDRNGQVLLEDVPLGEPPPVSDPLEELSSRTEEAAPDTGAGEYPEDEPLPTDQIISPEVAYLMCDLLKAVVTEGTGRNLLSLGRPLAGKTGTTNDFADAWFMGFSPDVVTGVWVGHDQAAVRLGWGESGARAALPIWKEFMAAALSGKPSRDFEVPDNIVFHRIDRETGLIADRNSRDFYFQPFLEGNVPTQTTSDASETTDAERALRSDAF